MDPQKLAIIILKKKPFWHRIQRSPTNNGCWYLKDAKVTPRGYVYLGNTTAHRVIYITVYGSIKHGLDVKHVCRNKQCINPSHLIAAKKGPPTGLPSPNKGKGISPEIRFWRFVDKLSSPNGCWLWLGHLDKRGYGSFTPSRIPIRAHRFAYELVYGSIPKGILVCHNCPNGDNPSCVNPAHLFLGTQKDNIQDALSKGVKIGWHKTGIVPIINHARGEDCGTSKLSESDVRIIRSLATSMTQKKLAQRFGVRPSAICKVIRRKTWTHVP